jgi:hypothetical protein
MLARRPFRGRMAGGGRALGRLLPPASRPERSRVSNSIKWPSGSRKSGRWPKKPNRSAGQPGLRSERVKGDLHPRALLAEFNLEVDNQAAATHRLAQPMS